MDITAQGGSKRASEAAVSSGGRCGLVRGGFPAISAHRCFCYVSRDASRCAGDSNNRPHSDIRIDRRRWALVIIIDPCPRGAPDTVSSAASNVTGISRQLGSGPLFQHGKKSVRSGRGSAERGETCQATFHPWCCCCSHPSTCPPCRPRGRGSGWRHSTGRRPKACSCSSSVSQG